MAAPRTQASCRNVSDRPNALERIVSVTSRWMIESSEILLSELATALTNIARMASQVLNSSAVSRHMTAAEAAPMMMISSGRASVIRVPAAVPTKLPRPAPPARPANASAAVNPCEVVSM